MSNNFDVSVVIPSYNQKKTILKTLKSIYDNKTDLKYEVIVVDSSPENLTGYIKKKFPNVKIIYRKERTLTSIANNIGIKAAKSDLILKTDTDVIVEKKWIEKMYKALQKYDIVGGGAGNANPDKILGWIIYLSEFSNFIPYGSKKEVTDIMGCNMGLRKEICKKNGYFINQRASTDLNFSWQHYLKGAKILFDPSIRVNHINKTNLGSIFKTQYWIGRASAWTRRRHKIPGKILVKIPPLIIFLPFIRLFSSFKNVFIGNKKWALIYISLSPLIFLVFLAYSIGFAIGAFDSQKRIDEG